jgi:raffinose/stachyose/melibiose transport system permease protein
MSLTAHTSRTTSAWNWLNKNKAGLIFILPALVMYAIFFINPFITSIYYSFTSWNGYDPVKHFVGLQNYARLFHDQMLWLALSHNLIWVLIGTAAPILIGLPLAVLLSSVKHGRLIFQTAYFLPYVLSGVLIGVIWGWIYNPVFGLLNYVLQSIGLGSLARGWLGDPKLALYAVLLAAVWGYFGFCVVIFMAGLQNLNVDLIEAAKIDGASSVQQFLFVIIPQLRNVLNLVIVYTMIGGFNVFDIIRVMTLGGPANHSEVIATYNYNIAFQQFDVGYGTTLSLVMTVLTLIISFVFISLRERQAADE